MSPDVFLTLDNTPRKTTYLLHKEDSGFIFRRVDNPKFGYFGHTSSKENCFFAAKTLGDVRNEGPLLFESSDDKTTFIYDYREKDRELKTKK
jgi:hypothetical protein